MTDVLRCNFQVHATTYDLGVETPDDPVYVTTGVGAPGKDKGWSGSYYRVGHLAYPSSELRQRALQNGVGTNGTVFRCNCPSVASTGHRQHLNAVICGITHPDDCHEYQPEIQT